MQNLKDAYRIQMERENESLPEGKKKRTEFPVPKIVENPDSGRNERKLDTGEPSEEQTEYFDYLTARMNAIESNARNSKYRRIDNPLWVLNDARIASLDIRTIDPTLPRNENGKVMRAARNIKRLYDQWDDVRGAQLVFCDLSTPKDKGFSVYRDMAEKLKAMGIPEREIAFIQEFDSDASKLALFRDVRAGKVRVLFGSTQKMGSGTNVQERLIALHHLDAPWRPADVEPVSYTHLTLPNDYPV